MAGKYAKVKPKKPHGEKVFMVRDKEGEIHGLYKTKDGAEKRAGKIKGGYVSSKGVKRDAS